MPPDSKAAAKLLSMHATTAAPERNWSSWGHNNTSFHSRLSKEPARKLTYVRASTSCDEMEGSAE